MLLKMWCRLRRHVSRFEKDVVKFADDVVPSRRRRREHGTVSLANTSTAYSTVHTSVEQVIYALAEDMDYNPENLSKARIADSLKRIARGLAPQYHSKMRRCDVEELEQYRNKLAVRLQQKQKEASICRLSGHQRVHDQRLAPERRVLQMQKSDKDEHPLAYSFSSMHFPMHLSIVSGFLPHL